MSDENKAEVIDLIVHATDNKPYEFAQTFNTLMADRLRAAIEAKQAELATNIFNSAPTEDNVEPEISDETE